MMVPVPNDDKSVFRHLYRIKTRLINILEPQKFRDDIRASFSDGYRVPIHDVNTGFYDDNFTDTIVLIDVSVSDELNITVAMNRDEYKYNRWFATIMKSIEWNGNGVTYAEIGSVTTYARRETGEPAMEERTVIIVSLSSFVLVAAVCVATLHQYFNCVSW